VPDLHVYAMKAPILIIEDAAIPVSGHTREAAVETISPLMIRASKAARITRGVLTQAMPTVTTVVEESMNVAV